jgi:hypothetical protein
MMNKQVYRCAIVYTDPRCIDTDGGNIFFRATSPEEAGRGAKITMKEKLHQAGYPDDTLFQVEVYASSEDELAAYRMHMNAPARTRN